MVSVFGYLHQFALLMRHLDQKSGTLNSSMGSMDVIGVCIQVLVALPLEAILTKCVVVVIGHKTFIVDMPNMIEME